MSVKTDVRPGVRGGYAPLDSGLLVPAAYIPKSGVGAPGPVLLQQQTAAASATLDFASCISSLYDTYDIEIVNLIVSGNNHLWWRAGTGGGPTYDTGNNYSYDHFVWRGGGSGGAVGTAQSKVILTYASSTPVGASATQVWSGRMRLWSPQSASAYKLVRGCLVYTDTGFRVTNEFRGAYESATAMTAFQFLLSAGTFTSGRIDVYGLPK